MAIIKCGGRELDFPDCCDIMSDDTYNLLLNKEEVKVIYDLLKYQYISYENTLALETVRKLGDWLDETKR